ncbi:penicillin acylase family protein [Longirhabdus pacifica]|uniref:penicillin acylase family protein n=1 Tax=Longirhabdus pacifica TaxID=2305227 RepID=UPI001008CA51|nr:penicillin acylase family protein [Longirhabdus pacifica]
MKTKEKVMEQALTRSLPPLEGNIPFQGLEDVVDVYRDERGVPHIEARSHGDLFQAQGYITAQDRLWQMDMTRRLASGRLSEVLGRSMLQSDRLYRKLQLKQAAEQSLTQYEEETMNILLRYAEGVNRYIEQAIQEQCLPIEFLILDYQPEPWSVVDTFVMGKLLSFSLAENFKSEAYRYELRKIVGDKLAQSLWPTYPDEGFITVGNKKNKKNKCSHTFDMLPDESKLHMKELFMMLSGKEEKQGSNGWVLSGQRTKSGKPLLANDPHIDMQTPATWYQTHLSRVDHQEKFHVIGVTLPGVPGIVLGHNDHIAWGVTNAIADAQDLYIEQLHPEDDHKVRYQGEWECITCKQEIIKIKGEEDEHIELKMTRHGPILIEDKKKEMTDDVRYGLALKWTAYEESKEIAAFLNMNTAVDWETFKQSIEHIYSPAMNVLFASNDGTIAMKTVGLIPIREKGDGLLPVPGWTEQYEWKGYVPFHELPEIVNPKDGVIVNANNKIVDDHYPHHITHAWESPYRAQRIYDELLQHDEWTVENTQQLQVDQKNLHAEKILPLLLKRVEKNEIPNQIMPILQHWNCVDDKDQAAPLLFQLWYSKIKQNIFQPLMGEVLYPWMVESTHVLDSMIVEASLGKENDWLKQSGGLTSIVTKSLAETCDQIKKLQGDNPDNWRWGKFHRLAFFHPLHEVMDQIGMNVPTPMVEAGGSKTTVGLMGNNAEGWIQYSAPWRIVIDLDDIHHQAFDILTPGQSGHMASPFYQDQMMPHIDGKLLPQYFKSNPSMNKLTLYPV